MRKITSKFAIVRRRFLLGNLYPAGQEEVGSIRPHNLASLPFCRPQTEKRIASEGQKNFRAKFGWQK